MGFFSRHVRHEPSHATAATPAKGSRGHVAEPYTMAHRPSFGQWLKHTWLDLLTMVIMGAIGLGVCDMVLYRLLPLVALGY
jgi:diacylglycerol diphosphate phosphatase / phosphatidate phosphatase